MDRNSDSDVSRSSPFTVTFALISALVFFFLVYYPRTALTIQESDGAEFALAAVKGMIDAGEARSVREASLTVAKLRAKGHAVEAMAERLRRKFRKVGVHRF